MTLRDLAKYFHLSINAASKEMNPAFCNQECLPQGSLEKVASQNSTLFVSLACENETNAILNPFALFVQIKSIKNEIAKTLKSMNSTDDSEKSRLMIESLIMGKKN